MLKCRLVKFYLVFASVFVLCACIASSEQKLVKQKCSVPACHTSAIVYNKQYSRNMWDNTVRAMEVNMVKRGMGMSAEERQTITDYLFANAGK